jgi:hypothetical protein
VRSHREPADLRFLGPKRVAAELPGEELAAEAQPEHRYVGVRRRPQEATLPLDPGNRVVEGGELRPERDDEIVVAGVGVAGLLVDAEDVLVGAALGKPLVYVPTRGRLLVLDHERPHRGPVAGVHRFAAAGTFEREVVDSARHAELERQERIAVARAEVLDPEQAVKREP